MSLYNKVAIVTGGASGIGKALVKSLLQRGSKACIGDISVPSGSAAVNEFAAIFGKDRVIFQQCDVTNRESLVSVFDKTKATFGSIDMVFNNAGRIDESNWENTIQVNLNGVIYGTKLAFDYMSKTNGGNGGLVINTASVAGQHPSAVCAVYSATKSAVATYTAAMSHDLHYKKHGVRVNAIGPSWVTTSLFDQLDETALDKEAWKERKQHLPFIEASVVSEACMELVEDESRNGEYMLIWNKDKRDYVTFPPINFND